MQQTYFERVDKKNNKIIYIYIYARLRNKRGGGGGGTMKQ